MRRRRRRGFARSFVYPTDPNCAINGGVGGDGAACYVARAAPIAFAL